VREALPFVLADWLTDGTAMIEAAWPGGIAGTKSRCQEAVFAVVVSEVTCRLPRPFPQVTQAGTQGWLDAVSIGSMQEKP
jgi:hypothetical protein